MLQKQYKGLFNPSYVIVGLVFAMSSSKFPLEQCLTMYYNTENALNLQINARKFIQGLKKRMVNIIVLYIPNFQKCMHSIKIKCNMN